MTSSPTTEVATAICHRRTYNVDAVHSTIGFVARHLVPPRSRSIHRVHRCDHHWRHARELQC